MSIPIRPKPPGLGVYMRQSEDVGKLNADLQLLIGQRLAEVQSHSDGSIAMRFENGISFFVEPAHVHPAKYMVGPFIGRRDSEQEETDTARDEP